jgi:hypothetical protein
MSRPVRGLPVANAGHAEHEPDHSSVAIERPGGHPADLLGDPQDGAGDALGKSTPPGLFLQVDTGGVFIERREVTYGDAVERIGHAMALEGRVLLRHIREGHR